MIYNVFVVKESTEFLLTCSVIIRQFGPERAKDEEIR